MMKKTLATLLTHMPTLQIVGDTQKIISGITEKSTQVKPGFLFVAIRGVHIDAHQFIPQAMNNGAVAIVGENVCHPEFISGSHPITYIQVSDSRKALGVLAANWYDNPSEKLTVIGITGTDGKTTTTNILYHILKHAKKRVSMISTVNAKINGRAYETGLHTTNPDALPLQKLLALMVEKKQEIAILETTSEGIAQERVAGVTFAIGVLTNITREHLNYHKTFEQYRDTKARLFEQTEINILNADDPSFEIVKGKTKPDAQNISYGFSDTANVYATDIKETKKGMQFILHVSGETIVMRTKLIGMYNVQNIVAAVATARSIGVEWTDIQKAVASFQGISGRMEIMQEKPFRIIVDFAHTPNALKQVLTTVKKQTQGKLIVVFGVAGERDSSKRAGMGEIATMTADTSIFTAEDPRSEDVTDILKTIVSGVGEVKQQGRDYFLIPDRGEAIEKAIRQLAQPGDTVIITGKGHEKSMAYQGIEYPWSDQEAVKKILKGEKIRLPWII